MLHSYDGYSLSNGRGIKCLTVADDFSHECVDIAVDYVISGQYVTRLLDQAAMFTGYPQAVRTDNGPEFTSRAFTAWAMSRGVRHILIQSGRLVWAGHLSNPQDQQLLVSGEINPLRQVHRFNFDDPSISGCDVDAVQVNDGVQRIQREALIIEPRPAGLVLGHDLRLEAAISVSRDVNGYPQAPSGSCVNLQTSAQSYSGAPLPTSADWKNPSDPASTGNIGPWQDAITSPLIIDGVLQ